MTALDRLRAGDLHQADGLRMARVRDLTIREAAALAADVDRFLESYAPSDVTDGRHVTNWTNPYGTARQFSLLNRSGDPSDFDSDHDGARAGKAFHQAADFPALADLVEALPSSTTNLRLNVLGPASGLGPHEEHLGFRNPDGTVRLRARFHLPVRTNPAAVMVTDGARAHFAVGGVYFFNNGGIHYAENRHPSWDRVHLVWDSWVNAEVDALLADAAEIGNGFGPPADYATLGPGIPAEEYLAARLVLVTS